MNLTTIAPAVQPAARLPFGYGVIAPAAEPAPLDAWTWAKAVTRSWGTASANARAAAVSILAGVGSQAGWEATAAPVDSEAVSSPVSFPVPAAEAPVDFADELLEAVYGHRPQIDRSARVRGYSDADASWWAAETDAMAKEDNYSWAADPEGRLDAMAEAEAAGRCRRLMEAGLGDW